MPRWIAPSLAIYARFGERCDMTDYTPTDIATLKKTLFFGALPERQLTEILAKSRIIEAAADEVLFRQGEPAQAIYAVLDGLVKLEVGRRDGQDVLVETFHAGASFAEALAFSGAPYPVTAVAIMPSRVLVAPSHSVQQCVLDDPEAFGAILSATYAHLHRFVRQIEELKGNSALERLARYILAMSEQAEQLQSFELPYEKQVLASVLGIKPESLSRAFRRLAEHGVLTEGRSITLQDVRKLHKFLAR